MEDCEYLQLSKWETTVTKVYDYGENKDLRFIDAMILRRIELGITRKRMALLCGVKERYIQQIENMKVKPSFFMYMKMASALGTTVYDLCNERKNKFE